MKNLYYSELRTQDYFKIYFKIDEAQNLFKWRVRMATLGENFRGNSGQIKIIWIINLKSMGICLYAEEYDNSILQNVCHP